MCSTLSLGAPSVLRGCWRRTLEIKEFKIGDKVVYPNHGLGVIEQIEKRATGDRMEEFLTLRIVANDSTVMVPRSNTANVGLRRVVTKEEVEEVFDVLKDTKITL
ncbi:MAG: hypothetical protein DMF51_14205 [Acidobacteria bacterium]|nr:MAG: hypothetical protein DMF51_14205 [Acidobacteriota bacterium]